MKNEINTNSRKQRKSKYLAILFQKRLNAKEHGALKKLKLLVQPLVFRELLLLLK